MANNYPVNKEVTVKINNDKTITTFWARIYMSGPLDVAKQVIRKECRQKGLCVTIKETMFIYTGGEESGFEVELIDYPRFPADNPVEEITDRAYRLAKKLIKKTCQDSALIMTPAGTRWISKR